MPDRNVYGQRMQVLQQRLHREELKLARLRTKANTARRSDARLKLRLGGLLFLMNRQNLSERDIEELVVKVRAALDDADDTETHRKCGDNVLKMLELRRSESMSDEKLEETQRRAINHQKITIGGILMKHGLDKFPRSIVLGALLQVNDSQIS